MTTRSLQDARAERAERERQASAQIPRWTDAQVAEARRVAYEEALNDPAVKAAQEKGRLRVRAIMSHPDAKERRELAMSLVFDTDMDVERALALLAQAPKGTSATGHLPRLMALIENPQVGTEGGEPAEPRRATSRDIYAARQVVERSES